MHDNSIKIVQIYADLVVYTQQIITHYEEFSYDEVYETYTKLINIIEERVKQQSLEHYNKNAFIAYIAWVDEQIMLSQLTFKKQWMKHLLQKKYFQTSNLGNEFFIHYNNLTQEEKTTKFIYLYILLLGFKGKYLVNESELSDFIEQELSLNKIELETDYFNHVYDLNTANLKPPVKKIQFFKMSYLIVIVIIALLFILNMNFFLENDLETLFERFENIQ